MILKVFKEKSNQKFINSLLSARRAAFSNSKVQTIGVLLNIEEYDDFESFRVYFKSLGLVSPKCKVVAFIDDEKKISNLWDTYFISKNFGWKGKILSVDLQSFINYEFDVLISYYKKDQLETNLITAMSKAKFKVGLSGLDERLYDLIIDVPINNFKTFKFELKKYLTVLRKL
ncbi:hypothetical protein RM697_02665 [Ichthyenterobacterium sp. W332]|uniref:Uncharacterized protein n=1 Tax=Microcosmobacter mediterraneus TaxID=3075607 RepID=A0ABU2YIN9_9FLAO|nr:hypothetical protein [Ichthyenterobacterium sp. W332]MDT0557534.1 hypothetical protein [Ichthyenterobacterium sp. W332]